MKFVTITALGFANGAPCAHAGQYLKSFDHEAHNGRGDGTFTRDLKKAMRFADAGEAFSFWRKQSVTKPNRDYGDFGPNRPMTALSIEINTHEEPDDLRRV